MRSLAGSSPGAGQGRGRAEQRSCWSSCHPPGTGCQSSTGTQSKEPSLPPEACIQLPKNHVNLDCSPVPPQHREGTGRPGHPPSKCLGQSGFKPKSADGNSQECHTCKALMYTLVLPYTVICIVLCSLESMFHVQLSPYKSRFTCLHFEMQTEEHRGSMIPTVPDLAVSLSLNPLSLRGRMYMSGTQGPSPARTAGLGQPRLSRPVFQT